MRFISLILVLCFVSTAAVADDVVFKNKDHITGKVLRLQEGKLFIDSDNAGELELDIADISTFSTDAPIEILFKDNTVLNKKVGKSNEGLVLIAVGPSESPLEFKIVNIKKINPAKVKWVGAVNLGAIFNRGNTYSNSASASIEAVRKSEFDRISFSAGYNGSRQKNDVTKEVDTTKRSTYLGLQFDYFFSKKIYGYGNVQMERDAPADLDMRFLTGAGAGWQIMDTDPLSLAFELGSSWVSEDFIGPTKKNEYFAGRAAYHVKGEVNNIVSFFHDAEWYPSLEHFSEDQYIKAQGGLRSALTTSLFAEFKAIWAWDTTPALTKKRSDVTYLMSIGWKF